METGTTETGTGVPGGRSRGRLDSGTPRDDRLRVVVRGRGRRRHRRRVRRGARLALARRRFDFRWTRSTRAGSALERGGRVARRRARRRRPGRRARRRRVGRDVRARRRRGPFARAADGDRDDIPRRFASRRGRKRKRRRRRRTRRRASFGGRFASVRRGGDARRRTRRGVRVVARDSSLSSGRSLSFVGRSLSFTGRSRGRGRSSFERGGRRRVSPRRRSPRGVSLGPGSILRVDTNRRLTRRRARDGDGALPRRLQDCRRVRRRLRHGVERRGRRSGRRIGTPRQTRPRAGSERRARRASARAYRGAISARGLLR